MQHYRSFDTRTNVAPKFHMMWLAARVLNLDRTIHAAVMFIAALAAYIIPSILQFLEGCAP